MLTRFDTIGNRVSERVIEFDLSDISYEQSAVCVDLRKVFEQMYSYIFLHK